MMRVKWRYALPLLHTLIDCILLAALIAYSNRVFRPQKSTLAGPTPLTFALFLQENSIEFDPRPSSPPGPFSLIMTGNLPAGVLSGVLRPEAGFIRARQRWDPLWFLIHESLSLSFWYLIGAWIDRGHVRFAVVMIIYFGLRLLLALSGSGEVGWKSQTVFWMGLLLWLVGVGFSKLIRVAGGAAKRA